MNTVVEDTRKNYSPSGLEKGSSGQDYEWTHFMTEITRILSAARHLTELLVKTIRSSSPTSWQGGEYLSSYERIGAV